MATKPEWKQRQHELNAWTKRYLRKVAPLHVDGVPGHATNRRIKWVKFYLGYGAHANQNSDDWTSRFVRSLRHPRTARKDGLTRHQIRVGIGRRTRQKARAAQQHVASVLTSGVTRFDGKPVAKTAVPILKWCRSHGWHGVLVSGWRSPAYSEHLCFNMCGRPSCPGRCAGRSTNHSGSTPSRFAVDVSDYGTFRNVVARCPLRPHIHNSLGSRDPVHFSPSGN
jgi:hypothetical protein